MLDLLALQLLILIPFAPPPPPPKKKKKKKKKKKEEKRQKEEKSEAKGFFSSWQLWKVKCVFRFASLARGLTV